MTLLSHIEGFFREIAHCLSRIEAAAPFHSHGLTFGGITTPGFGTLSLKLSRALCDQPQEDWYLHELKGDVLETP